MGRSGRLTPAFSSAGLEQLMIPVRDAATLPAARPGRRPAAGDAGGRLRLHRRRSRAAPVPRLLRPCRHRGGRPPIGPQRASGSHEFVLGAVDLEVMQGVEMGRPSHIMVKADGAELRSAGPATHPEGSPRAPPVGGPTRPRRRRRRLTFLDGEAAAPHRENGRAFEIGGCDAPRVGGAARHPRRAGSAHPSSARPTRRRLPPSTSTAKSFCCVAVSEILAALGLGIDVCTGGELASALAA